MGGVDFDREAIERRDFPIARRGYSPSAVDAHLRALADEIEQLRRAALAGGDDSLGATAATQVRSILEAAEAAAADIRNRARANAGTAKTDADRDAETTRAEAAAEAQAHVAAVAEASAALLARIESIDNDLGALFESLRGGANRLAAELTDVEAKVGELYGGASHTAPAAELGIGSPAASGTGLDPQKTDLEASRGSSGDASAASGGASPPGPGAPAPTAAPAPAGLTEENGDLEGARLTILNMALSGEPRERADRYLAEHFRLPDREKLIDEVYAAIGR
jgi:DivIVA domain-containing protein